KRAQENVPDRQVAIVIGVQIALVMHAMRFRSLDEISQPMWRAYIHVLEKAVKRCNIAGKRRGQWIEPEHQGSNKDGHCGENHHLGWMKHRRARHVHALWTMVDLVKQPPHDRNIVY